MAPTRSSKSVKRRLSSENSPDKEVGNSSRSTSRKKKLSDKLGAPWSKEELEHFYEAFRKYGKEWKKVAKVMRNRSVEMVEALYNMNQAYLSLPEGTASVVGLVAMMTDHYNVLGGSDSDQGRDDAFGIPQKSQKHKQLKVQQRSSKEDIYPSPSTLSTDGCLSLLRNIQSYANQPRVTGKRTLRYHVSHFNKSAEREDNNQPNKRARKTEFGCNDDQGVLAALALTQARQSKLHPKLSQKQYRRPELNKFSPIESWDRMLPRSGTIQSKLPGASMCEEWMTGGKGIGRCEKGAYMKNASSLMDIEGVGTVEVVRKGKKLNGKKVKVEEIGNSHSDDGEEACSGTGEGFRGNCLKGKTDNELNDKTGKYSPQEQRKRNKKLYFEDESSALEALQTLANLSTLMLPTSPAESESSAQLKEERTMIDIGEKSDTPEVTPKSHFRQQVKNLRKGKSPPAVTGIRVTPSRKSKLGRHSSPDVKVSLDVKKQPQSRSSLKRRQKPLVSNIPITETPMDSHHCNSLESEELDKDENLSVVQGNHSGQIFAESKHRKSMKVCEDSSSFSDKKKEESDLVSSTAQCSALGPVSWRSKHKMALRKTSLLKQEKSSGKDQLFAYPLSHKNNLLSSKEKLSRSLSSPLACRWCTYEWFYSALDYPWFAKREYADYLAHVGLGNIQRLNRVEWGVVRSSLGKPRRFCERFLNEERSKLKQYRESVRIHYTELRNGVREGLPTDLARPLSVGKRVLALHPQTMEVHDGKVLTVDHDKCSILFDRTELGVEFVKDIDCMPVNFLDYMPEALRRRKFAAGRRSLICNEPPLTETSNFGGSMLVSPGGPLESPVSTLMYMDSATVLAKKPAAEVVATQKAAYNQPCITEHNRARDADVPSVSAFSDLSQTLDKKASSGLSNMTRSNYHQNHLLARSNLTSVNPKVFQIRSGSQETSFAPQDSSSVHEIVNGSRIKAHAMVDAAVKVLSSIKEGDNPFKVIGEALDSIHTEQDLRAPMMIKSQELANGSLGHFKTGNPLLYCFKLEDGLEACNTRIPSELIASCVATLLMIQTCTEGQYPPADVAQIIDTAVTSLHPRCLQNLSIYREIQMCMGMIKTQMLALIPT